MIRIHINSRQGMFTVDKYNSKKLWLSTKHYEFTTDVSDFKCIAGGFNNHLKTQELHDFQMVVDPSYRELEARTQEMLKKLQILQGELVTDNDYTDLGDILQPEDYYPSEEDRNDPVYQEEPDEDEYMYEYEVEPPTYEQYKKWYEDEKETNSKLRHKIMDIAKVLYIDLSKFDFSEYENTKGTKFIIQSKYGDKTDVRFCCDPYAIMDNYHSNISEAYSDQGYGTDNGGWIKVYNKMVVLYARSGDYGKYHDKTAKEAVEKLFPYHRIYSYSGRDWDIDLDRMMFLASYPDDISDDELPF